MISARLIDQSLKTVLQHDYPLAGPVRVWHGPTGDLEQHRILLPIDRSIPTGVYALDVLLFDRLSLERLPLTHDGHDEPENARLGELLIARPDDVTDLAHAEPSNPLNAVLGDEIGLLGFDVSRSAATPGDAVTVVLYWRAFSAPRYDYTVFVQAIGPSGLVAQSDSYPMNGRIPFTHLPIDSVVRDAHTLAIPFGVPTGKLDLIAGLYRGDTLQRLPIRLSGSEAVADQVTLRQLPVTRGP